MRCGLFLIPLVHLLKSIIIVRSKFAHLTVIGIKNLFFMVEFQEGRMLLHDLNRVGYRTAR
jgi:hypothetical protein